MSRRIFRIAWTIQILASAILLSVCASCASMLDNAAKKEGLLISSELSRVITNMPPHKYEIDGTANVTNGASLLLSLGIKAFHKQQCINKNTYIVEMTDNIKAAILGGFQKSGRIERELFEPGVRVVATNPVAIRVKVEASINGVKTQKLYAAWGNRTSTLDLSEQLKKIVPPEQIVSSFELLVTVDDPPGPGEGRWNLAPDNWSDSIIVLAEFGNKDAIERMRKKHAIFDTYARWAARTEASEVLRYSQDEHESIFLVQQRRSQASPMAAMAGALVGMIETVEAMEDLAPEIGAGYGQRLEAVAKRRGKDVDCELLLFARALDNDPKLTLAERDKIAMALDGPGILVRAAEKFLPGSGADFMSRSYSAKSAMIVAETVTMASENMMAGARAAARRITIPGVEAARQSEVRGAIIERYIDTLYRVGDEPKAVAALRDELVEECGMDASQASSVALDIKSVVAESAVGLYIGNSAVDMARYVGYARALSKRKEHGPLTYTALPDNQIPNQQSQPNTINADARELPASVDTETLVKFFYVMATKPGHSPSYAEAVRWLHMRATEGGASMQGLLGDDAAMQGLLGDVYATGGDGVPKDVAEAVKWYQKAAEKGSKSAKHALLLMGVD